MNRRQMLIDELRKALQPDQRDEYCIRTGGICYRFEDIDVNWRPLPSAKGLRLNRRNEQIYRIAGCDIIF